MALYPTNQSDRFRIWAFANSDVSIRIFNASWPTLRFAAP